MDHPPGADTVVVRYGDISMKSPRVRQMMVETLLGNLRWRLADADIEASIEREWTRPLIRVDQSVIEVATEVAADTIGVVSASPSVEIQPELAAIVDTIERVARAHLDAGTFAVRARRGDKSLPFTSTEIERTAGAAILDALGTEFDIGVDLEEPDMTFHVDVRTDRAFVFTDVIDGPGGLPVGSQGPMVALISGGIDSPVAAYQVMRRGSPVIPMYIDLGDYTGFDHQARALEAIATLMPHAADKARPAYIVDASEFVDALVSSVDRGRMLVLRRFMFRVANRIAEQTDGVGIVTGEALGQKSSQTASNLAATGTIIERPIHRPLLAWDKAEITEAAKRLGTFQSATIDAGCPSIAPDAVMTKATPKTIDTLEFDDIDQRVQAAVDGVDTIDIERLTGYRRSISASAE